MTGKRIAAAWVSAAGLAGLALAAPAGAAEGERVTVTGEIIDTWCYYSGVMGGPDAVVGSAHHTCALWCSRGGIPVGVLGEDGSVYMVLKIDEAPVAGTAPTQLNLASHTVTVDGTLYERDGIRYLTVAEVVSDQDITNPTHQDYGTVPPFAIPDEALPEDAR